MFGKNPIVKPDWSSDGKHLRIVKGSPFYTIQGEGPFAGWPAVFIRMHGCSLRCTFCDTNFSDPADPFISVEALVKEVDKLAAPSGCQLVVLTGGEPTGQNIDPLVELLHTKDYRTQVETFGAFWRKSLDICTVVVSPKTSIVDPLVADAATAWKYVVSASMEFTDYGIPITASQEGARPRPLFNPPLSRAKKPLIYYSPMDEYDPEKNAANLAKALELGLKYGRIVLPQVHKVLQVKEPV